MENTINHELRETVERHVRRQFSDMVLEDVLVKEGYDADDDRIVDVVVVFKKAENVTGFSSMTRSLWTELARKDYGFPILSFRTSDENARLFAAA